MIRQTRPLLTDCKTFPVLSTCVQRGRDGTMVDRHSHAQQDRRRGGEQRQHALDHGAAPLPVLPPFPPPVFRCPSLTPQGTPNAERGPAKGHAKNANTLTHSNRILTNAEFTSRLHVIYVVNDVLHACLKKRGEAQPGQALPMDAMSAKIAPHMVSIFCACPLWQCLTRSSAMPSIGRQ